jgi:hypothetical protein
VFFEEALIVITIFNRKQLIITYDITVQAKIRDILAMNNVDYRIHPIMLSARTYTPPEYKIYVKKTDYDYASYLIRNVFRNND